MIPETYVCDVFLLCQSHAHVLVKQWSGMPPISTAAPELLPEATVNTMWSVVKTLIVNPVITIIIYFGWMIIAVTVACSCLCGGNRR